MNDPFYVRRFLDAQQRVYPQVCAELRAGRKTSHWMWFIFPQLQGLGSSPTAVRFAITSREEAEAYLRHPVLEARLRECTSLVNAVEGREIDEIFGYPDDLKFRSSMTLFATVAQDHHVFHQALQKYFAGDQDPLTLELLKHAEIA